LSRSCGGPVVENVNNRISTTNVPILMPSPQSVISACDREGQKFPESLFGMLGNIKVPEHSGNFEHFLIDFGQLLGNLGGLGRFGTVTGGYGRLWEVLGGFGGEGWCGLGEIVGIFRNIPRSLGAESREFGITILGNSN